jgi:hypothetical protein
MNVINVRSPYFIEVNESDNIGSKIELFIYIYGQTAPSSATYTVSKDIPTLTQKRMTYNISGLIADYIEPIKPTIEEDLEDSNNYCFVNVKRYKLVGSTYTLLDTTTYVCLYGFNNYSNGYNQTFSNARLLFGGQKLKVQDSNTYLNAYLPAGTYKWYYGSLFDTIVMANDGVYKLPIIENLDNVCILKSNGGTTLDSVNFEVVCEPKYTPVVCSFINRYGGWQFLTFFKAKSESFSATSTSYNLLPSDVDYNVYKGQKRSLNYNANEKLKLNTGWVYENYSDIIKDLLVSETVLLDNKPVEVKTQGTDIKSSLKDRMINYEIEFEYAYNFINNVI